MELEKIKKKREELMTNYNSLVDKKIENFIKNKKKHYTNNIHLK